MGKLNEYRLSWIKTNKWSDSITLHNNGSYETNTYLFIITSFQDRDIDLSTSKFRMTMKTERWMNDERFVNDRWTLGERTVNALWTVNASERWTLNAKLWMMNARWAHAEWTVNGRWANGERTQKWESRTFQGL